MESLFGLAIGAVLGTCLGLLLWVRPSVAYVAKPYVTLLGALPVFALAPVLIIWFGTGFVSKLALVAFSTGIVSLIQAYNGALTAGKEHLELARALGATRLQLLQKIIVPSAISWVLTGLRMNIGFAIIAAFIGEFISAEAGLGHYILRASALYDVPRVLAGLVVLTGLALVQTNIVDIVEQLWFPWCRGHRQSTSS
jgi:NitT/TauT family transport system permease protein